MFLVECQQRNSLIIENTHFFSFQTWSVCRDCVVSGKAQSHRGESSFYNSGKRSLQGGQRGGGHVTRTQLSVALVVKVLTMCACRDNFMRYFYFIHFICIYKNKLAESDEPANVLKLTNNNGKTGTQFFKTKTHNLSGSRLGLKFQGHHCICCGKGNYFILDIETQYKL